MYLHTYSYVNVIVDSGQLELVTEINKDVVGDNKNKVDAHIIQSLEKVLFNGEFRSFHPLPLEESTRVLNNTFSFQSVVLSEAIDVRFIEIKSHCGSRD